MRASASSSEAQTRTPRGTPASWLARAMLNCVNSVWNPLLKWAEWVDPSGSVAGFTLSAGMFSKYQSLPVL